MSLSPQLVQRLLSTEHGIRRSSFSSEDISAIIRYGSIVGHAIEIHTRAERCLGLARHAIQQSEESGDSFCSGSVFIAEELTGGKGRFQRDWHAPKGGVWMAVALVNTLLPKHSLLLPLAAGVACCETVRHYNVPAHIKWVNDVHVNGAKVAGILAETMIGPQSGEEYILLGIGLNVNNRRFPEPLVGKAVGMDSFTTNPLSLPDVSAMLLAKLAWNIGLLHFQEQCHLATGSQRASKKQPLLDSWQHLSDTIGRRVQYGFNVVSSPQYSAKVMGVDGCGALKMQLADGSQTIESGGEISYL